ncbi:unnamed protein product, partial [Darwinula stevensoni]
MDSVTMRSKKKHLLVLLSIAFLLFCYFGAHRLKRRERACDLQETLPSYLNPSVPSVIFKSSYSHEIRTTKCDLKECFNFTACLKNGFRVHVYQSSVKPVSDSYQRILNVLRQSSLFTPDPSQACLFILDIDTLDRDILSNDYVTDVPSRLKNLPLWNGGMNHVIFNFFAGTWPDYEEDLGFDTGKAILAKASMSQEAYRVGFDISLPLVHSEHPEKGGEPGLASGMNFPLEKEYIISFKGKRYTHGIGSETRNSLFHLHNGEDIIFVATCRHGKSWKQTKDERCDEDDLEFERQVLLQNSTTCLVPRGRRLGSYRFLEALRAGCIPVVLANSWVLPFSEVINWSQASLILDERDLLQVPQIIRSLSQEKILAMRQQTQFLWERYFSSMESIVMTTLKIIEERIWSHMKQEAVIWNMPPGGIFHQLSVSSFPPICPICETPDLELEEGFTALIYVTTNPASSTVPFFHLLKNVLKSRNLSKVSICPLVLLLLLLERIVVLWCADSVPQRNLFPVVSESLLHILVPPFCSVSARFYPYPILPHGAVFSLDEDASINSDELDFAYQVWRHFPQRIIGYPARSHFWDDAKNSWGYTSKSPWNDPDHFVQRQSCINTFVAVFGYMPLIRSNLRLDPLLFLDDARRPSVFGCAAYLLRL